LTKKLPPDPKLLRIFTTGQIFTRTGPIVAKPKSKIQLKSAWSKIIFGGIGGFAVFLAIAVFMDLITDIIEGFMITTLALVGGAIAGVLVWVLFSWKPVLSPWTAVLSGMVVMFVALVILFFILT
jgi:hypothetical protein